ncbi:adenine phosphoribosyltransferase 4-like [Canna indica]|uniref:adenine phosphoribosyltransferase n=1 Tax=Canna indica TaxID=4628 RepID=A0AAQ3QJ86_9LILI|nr:adenine phosphoribosyltransferase 4-like [Canna indica]
MACGNDKEQEQDRRVDGIKASIRVVPDFPKKGIMFQDITTLLLEPKTFKNTVDLFVERYLGRDITVVAGIEARGFIFGPPIALAIGAKFVPLRKPQKLPGEVISEKYVLEYGTDCLEMHVGAVQPGDRALVVDDLVATGGTLCAAMNLLERAGAEVVECACVIELPKLKGSRKRCCLLIPFKWTRPVPSPDPLCVDPRLIHRSARRPPSPSRLVNLNRSSFFLCFPGSVPGMGLFGSFQSKKWEGMNRKECRKKCPNGYTGSYHKISGGGLRAQADGSTLCMRSTEPSQQNSSRNPMPTPMKQNYRNSWAISSGACSEEARAVELLNKGNFDDWMEEQLMNMALAMLLVAGCGCSRALKKMEITSLVTQRGDRSRTCTEKTSK